jgi:hypothetical protein
MSTAYHPQSDGQTERANRTIEDMLRAFVNYQQNDWDQFLTAAEIACNNSQQSSIKFSPFWLNYGRHLNFPLSSLARLAADKQTESHNPDAGNLADNLKVYIDVAKQNLNQARLRQTQFANAKRTETSFEVGQQVYLSTSNLNLEHRAPKLMAKFIGPFEIVERIGQVAYKLKLPETMSIHPVFHVSKLRLHNDGSDQFPSRPKVHDRPTAVIPDEDHLEWEVDQVVNHRKRGKNKQILEYLVLWKGYPEYEKTWEREVNLKNAEECIKEYWYNNNNNKSID